MDPLSITASVIAIIQLTGSVLSTLREVRGTSKDREKLTLELSNLYGLLINLQSRLEIGNDGDPWFTAVKALNTKNGPLDNYKQGLKELQTKLKEKQGVAKLSQTVLWRMKNEEIEKILTRMERLKSFIQIALESDHFKLSLAIKSSLDGAHVDSRAIKQTAETVKRSDEQKQHEELLKWISTTNYPAEQSDIIRERQQHTGKKFLNSPDFVRWKGAQSETLYCPGIPGGGKTMTCAIAIDHLLNETLGSTDVALAYVYCNYKKAQADQDVTNLIAAILKQLVQSFPSKAGPLKDLFETHGPKDTKPSVDETVKTLQLVVVGFSHVYIIVDALDECPERGGTRRKFLSKLRDIQAVANVSLMLTSRPLSNIQIEVQKAFPGHSSLEIRAEEDDIRKYVTGRMEELPNCIRSNDSLQRDIEDAIVQAVDGMFLLARLYVVSLESALRVKDVRRTIQTLRENSRDIAKAYDHAYDEALLRIKSQDPNRKELAERALSWVTCAKTQLTTDEFCHAVSVAPSQQEIDEEDVYNIVDVTSVSAGLIIVDEESNIVRLVHYTTQEFFEREWQRVLPTAQIDVIKTCLTYLSFPYFQTIDWSFALPISHVTKIYPLLKYTALHWGEHVVGHEEQTSVEVFDFLNNEVARQVTSRLVFQVKYQASSPFRHLSTHALQLLAHFGLVTSARMLYPSLGRDELLIQVPEDAESSTPLCCIALEIAACNGHAGFVIWILNHCINANVQIECQRAFDLAVGGTHTDAVEALLDLGGIKEVTGALRVACEKGQKELLRLLIDKGFSIDTEDQFLGTALHMASASGQTEIVQMLLDAGADINIMNEYLGSALQRAVFGGHQKIANLLIDRGADLNIRGGEHIDLITAAAHGNLVEIIELALRNGASIDGEVETSDNPLIVATRFCRVDMLKFLLDKGANVDWQDETGKSALQVAAGPECSPDSTIVAELLIDHGALVNAAGGAQGTALAIASLCGKIEIGHLLLNSGADVNAQGGKYGNALQAASRGRDTDIVKLLLASGANVNAQGGWYGNSLQAASFIGNVETIEALLAHGAHVNAEGGAYGTALLAASLSHQKKFFLEKSFGSTDEGCHFLVKILIDRGANVDSRHPIFGCALQLSSLAGHEKMVKLLLESGADTNVQGGRYNTALQAAASEGFEKITEILIEKGADVHLLGGIYGSAFHAAARAKRWGHELNIVRRLLEQGADVNQVDSCGNTVLMSAAREQNIEIARLLIDKGADVGDGMKRNPLFRAAFSMPDEFNLKESAKLLIKLGANDTIDVLGKSLLHYFAGAADVVSIGWAINHKFHIHWQDQYGWSPLHWLAFSKKGTSFEAVEMLVQAGADLTLQDKDGHRPVEIAALHGQKPLITKLLCQAMNIPEIETSDGEWMEALCDFCYTVIYDILNHCTTCIKYDLCYRCIHDVSKIHPAHVFTQDFRYSVSLRQNSHFPETEGPDWWDYP